MPPIPEPEKAPVLDTLQTSAVAELPQKDESPELDPYRISFADYNSGECEIDGLEKQNGAMALKVLRDVGVYFTDEANFSKNSSNVTEIRNVVNSGVYTQIYKGLEADKEVREIKSIRQKKDVDIRIFFYELESERTFYVLAVRQSHYDTTKTR
jgi:Fe-S-cluster formation regulator IscX/YfhJ